MGGHSRARILLPRKRCTIRNSLVYATKLTRIAVHDGWGAEEQPLRYLSEEESQGMRCIIPGGLYTIHPWARKGEEAPSKPRPSSNNISVMRPGQSVDSVNAANGPALRDRH